MKRLVSLLLIVAIGFWVLPVTSFAIVENDLEFETFLTEINWDKQDYIDYLEGKEWYLEDFDSVDELGTPLTEESIQPVLEEFNLTREELNALLVEYGDIEEGQDVLEGSYLLFSEELRDYVDYYINGYTGTPIDDENLQELLDYYGFTSKEELEEFLNEYDDSIEYYEYIEDLDFAVDYYLYGGDDYAEDIFYLFEEIGLTMEELERLFAHFETLPFDSPEFEESLYALSDRMMAFEYFETVDQLSADQLAELANIYIEMLDLFELDTNYYLVKDGEKIEVSIQNLMSMETTNGYNLLIEFYNYQGDFLADILLTADMFGSELIQETGKDIIEVDEIIKEVKQETKSVKTKDAAAAATDQSAAPVKTVKGAELPTTASNYLLNTIAGMTIILTGLLLFRRFRTEGI